MEKEFDNNIFFTISELSYIKSLVESNPNDFDLGSKIRKYFLVRKKLTNNTKEKI